MKQTIAAFLDSIQDKLYAINDYIYQHPELGRQEYRAVEMLTGLLKEYGFALEIGLCGYDTAFRAE
ncbi:MAG TPA: amidohydrolase, partial [Firmicutes bacterium]|nr:amidohydrolase [Bacillota bacterium]